MKYFVLSAVTTVLFSTAMFAADDQGHNGDEAKTVTCRVQNQAGADLPTQRVTKAQKGEHLVIAGEGEEFTYRVELAEGVGRLTLLDKRSGDQVTVREGDFDINEEVAVTLTTDELPDAALTLLCKATL